MSQRKPKVLFVTKCLAPPFHDGGKLLPLNVARHLTSRRVHLLTQPGVAFPQPHIMAESVFPPSHAWLPGGFGHLAVFLRLLRFDEIPLYHFFFAPNPASSYAARLALGLKGRTATVQTLSSAPRSTSGLASLLFGDTLVCVSETTARVVREHTKKPVTVISPSVDVPPLPSTSERDALRTRLGLSPSDCALLFAGDLDPGDTGAFLARVLPKMAKLPHWVLFLAVRLKTERSRLETERLHQRVTELGLLARVRFLGTVEDFPALLSAMDVQLFPADTLAAKVDLPFVLLEGMAHGLPALTSNLPSLLELGDTDAVGPRHAVDDDKGFLTGLEALLMDKALRERIGRLARQRAGDVFSHERMARAYEDLYRSLEREP